MPLRTFIAIPIDPGPRLCRVTDQLGLIGAPVRISQTADLHLTLKFLGDTDENLVPQIVEWLDQLGPIFPALDVSLKGLGVFSDRRRPTVVWAGLQDSVLTKLQKNVEEGMNALGWPPEQRPWRPHVTLARINPRKPVPALLNELLDECASRDFGAHPLNRLVLYQSTSTSRGPVYSELHSVPLMATVS